MTSVSYERLSDAIQHQINQGKSLTLKNLKDKNGRKYEVEILIRQKQSDGSYKYFNANILNERASELIKQVESCFNSLNLPSEQAKLDNRCVVVQASDNHQEYTKRNLKIPPLTQNQQEMIDPSKKPSAAAAAIEPQGDDHELRIKKEINELFRGKTNPGYSEKQLQAIYQYFAFQIEHTANHDQSVLQEPTEKSLGLIESKYDSQKISIENKLKALNALQNYLSSLNWSKFSTLVTNIFLQQTSPQKPTSHESDSARQHRTNFTSKAVRQPTKANGTSKVKSEYSTKIGETKLSLVQGDIFDQKVAAIVNAANTSLTDGSGINGQMHERAGDRLANKCKEFSVLFPSQEIKHRCLVGEVKVTESYNINRENSHIKKIIHAVGPDCMIASQNTKRKILLTQAYQNSLKAAHEERCRSIAFPAISAGIFGYDPKESQEVALEAIQEYLKKNPGQFDKVLLVYLKQDKQIYRAARSAWKAKIKKH